jgi:F-type H+-transporting ATPase subunit delta
MSEIQVASRYAKSLIDLAQEQNALEDIKADIETFVNVLKQNPQLSAILKNPIIGPDKKLGILSSLFAARFHAVVLSFFKIVVSKGRSEILPATAREFMNEYNRRKGVLKATVTSAAALSANSLSELTAAVASATGKEVVLDTRVDADLIGGFVLKVGDKQLDTSIAGQLSRLKKELAS